MNDQSSMLRRPRRREALPTDRHVLVVDDSRAQRRVLSVLLQRWGYRVTEAGSGEAALALCRGSGFDMVVSDWMMPGMSGLEFCRAFRALPREGYAYFILLTSRSAAGAVVDGLDCGADDFLGKPVAPDELRARLRAGERILGMQAELVEKNHLLGAALGELRGIQDALDRDLIEARKLQQALTPDRRRCFGGSTATMLIRPAGPVGGDLAGCFEIGPGRAGLYSVDVSGHGIASAMMTTRLAGLLSAASPERNLALSGAGGAWPPEELARRFNRMMLEELRIEQYFTMAYAEVDLGSGRVALVQAGHPYPAVLRRDGTVEFLGAGGLPIGLIEQAIYDRVEAQLAPGDRLLLLSDGVTDCRAPDGAELGQEGLARILRANAGLGDAELLEALVWKLHDHAGGADLADDASGVLFCYQG
ncbi:sigma-B regulation protein RsbU (phosphoserine phosphatase) [Cereibacter changlensis]|nr:sigma-B regulation protein RsbU (phosphoserine phosphatase) [Cereibacter changlensis]